MTNPMRCKEIAIGCLILLGGCSGSYGSKEDSGKGTEPGDKVDIPTGPDADSDTDTDTGTDTDSDTQTDSVKDPNSEPDTEVAPSTDTITEPDTAEQQDGGGGPCDPQKEVRQPETDLCWMRCPLTQEWTGTSCEGVRIETTWCDATGGSTTGCEPRASGVNLCELLLGKGYRLPTEEEFLALFGNCWDFQHHICDACIQSKTCSSMFGSDGEHYWSSTENDASAAWYAGFDSGNIGSQFKRYDSCVRCVRVGTFDDV